MIKNKIITCFNAGAKSYDAAADVQVVAAKHLATQLTDSANTILEIGCGTGLFSQYLIEQFPNKNILLTDIAPEMIKVANTKFINYSNVATVCMDGEHLSLNNAYDLIASNMAMHWFSNLNNSMKTMMASLNPGGQFIFSLLGENSLKEWRDFYPNTLTFPSAELLAQQFPDITIQLVQYSQPYTHMLEFLRTLKAIGGTVGHADRQFSVRQLRSILRADIVPFNVTYEIIYGQYQRP